MNGKEFVDQLNKQIIEYRYQGVTYHVKHGDPFDRGMMDSYYSRGTKPHKRLGGSGQLYEVIFTLTPAEIDEYCAGYNYNEGFGEKKDWR